MDKPPNKKAKILFAFLAIGIIGGAVFLGIDYWSWDIYFTEFWFFIGIAVLVLITFIFDFIWAMWKG